MGLLLLLSMSLSVRGTTAPGDAPSPPSAFKHVSTSMPATAETNAVATARNIPIDSWCKVKLLSSWWSSRQSIAAAHTRIRMARHCPPFKCLCSMEKNAAKMMREFIMAEKTEERSCDNACRASTLERK